MWHFWHSVIYLWSYSDDREGILHKKVEYEGDDTYEGEDRHPKISVKNLMEKQNTGYLALPNVLSSLCRIQLILGHISRMEIRTLSGFYSNRECLWLSHVPRYHNVTLSQCHMVGMWGYSDPVERTDYNTYNSLLYIISQLPQGCPQLHHVLRNGVKILQSAVDVAGPLFHIQCVVQNYLN